MSATAFLIGSLWFCSSAFLSTWANSTFLKEFNDPLLHNFVRFFGSSLLSILSFLIVGDVNLFQVLRLVSVPATFLFLANYSNSISLGIAGITLTYVVKASIPVLTVVMCTMGGARFPIIIYLSLLPICFGIVMATGGDLDFSVVGLLAALFSSLTQASTNITIKDVRKKTNLSGPKAFMGMSCFCTLLALPLLLLNVSPPGVPASKVPAVDVLVAVLNESLRGDFRKLSLFGITAFGYYAEYVLTFIFVGYVSSVTFSVTDIARRLGVIVVGSVIFKKPLSIDNWCGIAVALGGVLFYSYLDNHYATVASKAADVKKEKSK